MRKPCIKCEDIKPLSDFHRHPETADGHVGICKVCHSARMRRRRLETLKEAQARDRERASLPHRKGAAGEKNARYLAANPEKRKAHWRINNALRKKHIVKPTICSVCEVESLVHGHHDDYSKPLEVRWLCAFCHGAVHRALNEQTRTQSRYPV